ncbi:MAG: hypothetical protein ACI82G_000639 [Bradymonadia bacterium]
MRMRCRGAAVRRGAAELQSARATIARASRRRYHTTEKLPLTSPRSMSSSPNSTDRRRRPHPVLRFGDAVVGVLKRHVLSLPTQFRDPWLLDDLNTLVETANRAADEAGASRAAGRMQTQLSVLHALREGAPPLEVVDQPRIVQWMHQQRTWYASTVQSRPRAGRRPAQLARLLSAAQACLLAAEATPTIVEDDRLQRIRVFVSTVSREQAVVLKHRVEMSPQGLVDALLAESEAHGRDAVLLDEHARETDEGRAAISRWLDREFELEAQWIALCSALPTDSPHEHWRHMQRNAAALREALQ